MLEKRVELSCHTYYSKLDGVLSPKEWVCHAHQCGVRALAITDFHDVRALGEAAWAVEELRKESAPESFDFKVLYGLEMMLENGCLVHLLARDQMGLEQLFRLLEIAWEDQERPFLRKAEIDRHRTGLLVGCPGWDGELDRGILENLDDASLEEIAGFYDYLSLLRPAHYSMLSAREPAPRINVPRPRTLISKIISIGKQLNKPVAAAGNARLPNRQHCKPDISAAYAALKNEDWFDTLEQDLPKTEDMLEEFSFLGEDQAEEIVLHTPNRLVSLCGEIRMRPEDGKLLQPILPDAFETVAGFCREQLQIRYDGKIPEMARERLEYELDILRSCEQLCSVLLIYRRLVLGFREREHLLAARGTLSASYAAYLLGVTEVDPLALRIPCETFWGFPEAASSMCGLPLPMNERGFLRVEFNLSGESWEETDAIFNEIFPQYTAIPWDHAYPAIGRRNAEAMVTAYSEKHRIDAMDWDYRVIYKCISRLSYVSCDREACQSNEYNRRILVPDTEELQRWMPLQKIGGKYHIYYSYDSGSPNLLGLLLIHTWPMELLRKLGELTGASPSSINAEEAVPLLLRDRTDIPVYKNSLIEAIWNLANPKTMEDIIKVFSLAHSTGTWEDNAETLLREGTVPFSEIIGSRDDVFCRLVDAGLDRADAYRIMKRVQTGKGLDEKCTSLQQHEIPEWFINSCNKIAYLFPKSHCAEVCAIPVLKAAWYKTHFPKEYAQVYSELYIS